MSVWAGPGVRLLDKARGRAVFNIAAMKEISIDASSPVLFVDGSYYIFHRYYATLRWWGFGMSKEDQADVVSNIHTDKPFLDAFFQHVKQDIRKWCSTFEVPNGNVVFGFDCPRQAIWRNELHPEYKMTRSAPQMFNGDIFTCFFDWFRQNAAEVGIDCIEMDCLEADDVIFLGVSAVQRMEPNARIWVLTNDGDYLQMRSENVTIINAQMQDLAKRSIGTAEQDLLKKMLMGDPCDNIAAVAPKVGPITAKKLALQGREAVEGWAQERGCVDKLHHNERLISFAKIPERLVEQFNNTFTWVRHG